VASSIGHNQRAISRVVQSASGAQPRMRLGSSVRSQPRSRFVVATTDSINRARPESKVFELSPMRARRLRCPVPDTISIHLSRREASGVSFIITASAIGKNLVRKASIFSARIACAEMHPASDTPERFILIIINNLSVICCHQRLFDATLYAFVNLGWIVSLRLNPFALNSFDYNSLRLLHLMSVFRVYASICTNSLDSASRFDRPKD